jgi:hypothetical protein
MSAKGTNKQSKGNKLDAKQNTKTKQEDLKKDGIK